MGPRKLHTNSDNPNSIPFWAVFSAYGELLRTFTGVYLYVDVHLWFLLSVYTSICMAVYVTCSSCSRWWLRRRLLWQRWYFALLSASLGWIQKNSVRCRSACHATEPRGTRKARRWLRANNKPIVVISGATCETNHREQNFDGSSCMYGFTSRVTGHIGWML